MNWVELEKKLITAARKNPPGDRVPYAFEQRVMACLKSPREIDPLGWWSRALWLGASACAAIALLTSVWSFAPEDYSDAGLSFSHGVEQTLFASAEDADNAW
jgi:hypothetical protein